MSHKRKRTIRRRASARRCFFECLEPRQLLAGNVTAFLSGDELHIEGTDANDLLILRQSTGQLSIDGVEGSFPVEGLNRVRVNAAGGNDIVNLLLIGNLPGFVDGGSGDDILIGGSGDDVLLGAEGTDWLMGAGGNDVLFGGEETDVHGNTLQLPAMESTLTADLDGDGREDFAVIWNGETHLLIPGSTLQEGVTSDFSGSDVHMDDHPSVVDVHVDRLGRRLALRANGDLVRLDTRTGESVEVGRDLKKFAFTSDGRIFTLSQDGDVRFEGGHVSWENVDDFAWDPGDRMLLLDKSGTLFLAADEFGNDFSVVGHDVSEYGFLRKERIFALSRDRDLRIETRQGWITVPDTTDVRLTSDGRIVSLTEGGDIYRNGRLSWRGQGYTHIALDAQDRLFAERDDGSLSRSDKRFGRGKWRTVPQVKQSLLTSTGAWVALTDGGDIYRNGRLSWGGQGYTHIALDAQDRLFAERDDGSLSRSDEAFGNGTWRTVPQVKQSLLTSAGGWVALTKGGDIYRNGRLSWGGQGYTHIALDAQDRLFAERDDGSLSRSDEAFGNGPWRTVPQVKQSLLTSAGAWVALTKGGDIYRNGRLSWGGQGYTNIALDAQDRLFAERDDGSLSRSDEAFGNGTWRTVSHVKQSLLTSTGGWVALTAGGDIYRNGKVSWRGQGYAGIRLDDRDRLLAWNARGRLVRSDSAFGDGNWSVLDDDMIRFELAPDGNVYSLGEDETLMVEGQRLGANTRDFFVTQDGTLYWQHTGGEFKRLPAGQDWQPLDNDMVRYQFGFDGKVYSLGADGWLNVDGTPSWGRAAAFALDSQNRLILIGTNGDVSRSYSSFGSGGWEDLASGVTKHTVASNDVVYTLDADNLLRVDGRRLGAGIEDYFVDDANTLYWQHVSGEFKRLPEDEDWQVLDNDMVKYQVDSTGTVFSLGSDGWLNVNGVPSWQGTKDFQLGDDDTVYWTSTHNELWQLPAGGSWKRLDNDVVKFVVQSDGTVLSLGADQQLNVDGVKTWERVRDFYWIDETLYIRDNTSPFARIAYNGHAHKEYDRDMLKFRVDSEGVVYTLGLDGVLSVDGVESWRNVVDFFVDDRDTLFAHFQNGAFQRLLKDTSQWEDVPRRIGNRAVVSMIDGELVVLGTPLPDIINVAEVHGRIYVAGVQVEWLASEVQRIVISTFDGNDNISLNVVHIPATIDAGGGNDRVVAGPMDDVIIGGWGSNDLYGGPGNDLFVAPGDPGDRSPKDRLAVRYGAFTTQIDGQDHDDTWWNGDPENDWTISLENGFLDKLEGIGKQLLQHAVVGGLLTFGMQVSALSGNPLAGLAAGPGSIRLLYGDRWDNVIKEYYQFATPIALSIATGGAASGLLGGTSGGLTPLAASLNVSNTAATAIAAGVNVAADGIFAGIDGRSFDFLSSLANRGTGLINAGLDIFLPDVDPRLLDSLSNLERGALQATTALAGSVVTDGVMSMLQNRSLDLPGSLLQGGLSFGINDYFRPALGSLTSAIGLPALLADGVDEVGSALAFQGLYSAARGAPFDPRAVALQRALTYAARQTALGLASMLLNRGAPVPVVPTPTGTSAGGGTGALAGVPGQTYHQQEFTGAALGASWGRWLGLPINPMSFAAGGGTGAVAGVAPQRLADLLHNPSNNSPEPSDEQAGIYSLSANGWRVNKDGRFVNDSLHYVEPGWYMRENGEIYYEGPQVPGSSHHGVWRPLTAQDAEELKLAQDAGWSRFLEATIGYVPLGDRDQWRSVLGEAKVVMTADLETLTDAEIQEKYGQSRDALKDRLKDGVSELAQLIAEQRVAWAAKLFRRYNFGLMLLDYGDAVLQIQRAEEIRILQDLFGGNWRLYDPGNMYDTLYKMSH